MPSGGEREPLAVARRYPDANDCSTHSWSGGGTYLTRGVVAAIAAGAVAVGVTRGPVLQGMTRLRTDDVPGAVVSEFAGPTPLALALLGRRRRRHGRFDDDGLVFRPGYHRDDCPGTDRQVIR